MPDAGDDLVWPAVGYESHAWQPVDDLGFSHRARRRTAGPYRAAVVPVIAGAELALPTSLLTDAAEAQAAIGRFDEYVSHALGSPLAVRAAGEVGESGSSGAPELGPMVSILLRTESASSSQIENLTVGARQLALAELAAGDSRRSGGSGNANLVVRNVAAVRAALAAADDLSVGAILRMHETLLSESDPHQAGRLRRQQVWIGGSGAGPHLASFVPPHHSRIAAALDDLVAFCDRDDVPALVQAAIAHAQFETIHPFTDGNGRTGRALVHALLRSKGVTRRVTVPVSAGLLTRTDNYFAALGRYRAGDPAPIIEQFTGAAFIAIDNGHQLLADVDAAKARWREVVRARRGASAWLLADQLVAHPVVTSASVQAQLGISQPVADTALRQLVEAEVLTPVSTDARRYRVWQAPEILAALEAFAARAMRRYPSG